MADLKSLSNVEAERYVLGALIQSPTVRNELLNKLTEEDFYDPHGPNRLVFRAVMNLYNNGITVDIATLTNELGINMKVLDSIGGVPFLMDLQEMYIGDRNALFHADMVKDLALSRNLSICLQKCLDGFEKKEFTDVGQYVAECESNILKITKQRRVSDFEEASAIVSEITDDLRINANKKHKKTQGVPSGFSTIDAMTHGWMPGQFNIIGARPSVGKTAFAINLAYNAASQTGNTVAFFSLEMDAKAIVKRLLACVASVSSDAITNGDLSDSDWLALDNAVAALKNTKILIDDTAAQKLTDIKTKTQKLKAEHPDLCCIFIDYLGLITTNNTKVDSRQNEVAEISRQLKALARETGVPIICLSQLSRANEQRNAGERMPKLSDLRDSGSIEQDADIVMFVHRENYQNQEAMKQKENQDVTDTNPFGDVEETTISIAKNRNGKTGPVKFSMLMNIGKFVETDTRGGDQQ